MHPVLEDLIALLELERIEDNIFRGDSRDIGSPQVFGGQGLGQALVPAGTYQLLVRYRGTDPDQEQVLDAVHAAVPPSPDPYVDLMPASGVKLTPRHYAYLKISEGCNHKCTFCIIPSLRGKLVSRPIGDVMGEAQRLAARTRFDIEMLQEVGYCPGIENYSRPLSGRPPGSTPDTSSTRPGSPRRRAPGSRSTGSGRTWTRIRSPRTCTSRASRRGPGPMVALSDNVRSLWAVRRMGILLVARRIIAESGSLDREPRAGP